MMPRTAASFFPAIWARAKERGVDEETVRDRVESITGQRSLRKMTVKQARELLDALGRSKRKLSPAAKQRRRLAQGNAGRKGDQPDGYVELAGPGDWRLLLSVGEARGWDEAAVRRWCERQIKRPTPRTMAEHNKCLWGLKAMNRRDHIADAPTKGSGEDGAKAG